MQQFCNNCGAPITAGMTACARCGAPVSSGSGGYDPTVRAGTPPGTNYGSQPYGTPPIDPYNAPPPPPPGFGSQPQSGYGAPPPPPGFGAPPPPPGFGPPPQPGFGAPQQPFMAPPPKKSKTWIYVLVGVLVLVLIVCGGIAYAINAGLTRVGQAIETVAATLTVTTGETPTLPSSFQQTRTTGPHITTIQTGTGFNQNTGEVINEKATFTTGESIWVVYTVANPDAGASVTLKLLTESGSLIDSGSSAELDTVTNQYANEVTINEAGIYKIEIDYNGAAEATINFLVS